VDFVRQLKNKNKYQFFFGKKIKKKRLFIKNYSQQDETECSDLSLCRELFFEKNNNYETKTAKKKLFKKNLRAKIEDDGKNTSF